ncbi:MAG: tetratricopeptide repeat-containing sulfotransferase family protein [Arenimonas sp.]
MTDMHSPADAASRQRRLAEGFNLLRQGRIDDAVSLGEALRAAQPDDPEAHFLASEAYLAAGDATSALACIEAAVRLRPNEATLVIKLAENLVMLRRRQDAKDVARHAAGMVPGDAATQHAIGRIFSGCDDPANARAYYERALAAGHAPLSMLYDLAVAQHFTGDIDRAETTIAAILAQAPQSGVVLHLRSTLRRATPGRNHVAELEALLAGPTMHEIDRTGALYALGRELEEMGEPARAFAAFREAAALRRASLRGYDPAVDIATIDALCATYDADEMARPVPGHDQDGPIFVVGMPRSGTTLVERILSRHSQVGSAGELLDFGQALGAAASRVTAAPGQSLIDASRGIDFAALGKDYLQGAHEAAPERRLFVDKLPVNFMYCGLIRRALPKARIVHVTREAMDSGYAVYKTLFGQAYLFSYDLREIADYLACYHRTMRHWAAVMPDDIVTVRYENLVADPEGQARHLLQALGLEWEPQVLVDDGNDRLSTTASAAQVREPIHDRSVGRWRDHEVDLAPLKDRLVELGVLDA